MDRGVTMGRGAGRVPDPPPTFIQNKIGNRYEFNFNLVSRCE